MIDTVFLDMDGVLVDFVGGICRAHKRENPYRTTTARGYYQIETLLELPWDKFARPMKRPKFWEDLEWTSDGRRILESVERVVGEENVFLLTRATKTAALSGKARWVQRHMPSYADRFITARHKNRLASPTTVLVDDCNENCDEFEARAGKAVLVPRAWNRGWPDAGGAVEAVRTLLGEALRKHLPVKQHMLFELERFGLDPQTVAALEDGLEIHTVEELQAHPWKAVATAANIGPHKSLDILVAEALWHRGVPLKTASEMAGMNMSIQYEIWKTKQAPVAKPAKAG